MLNIEPIKLLSGSHADTAQTGSGCFMNVIAYLNGEPVITDESPCVCRSIRRIAIWTNDFLRDGERQVMLKYVQRAMGSVTDDKEVMIARLDAMRDLIGELARIAKVTGSSQVASRAAASLAIANMTREHSGMYLESAGFLANAAVFALSHIGLADFARKTIIDRVLAYMEAVCPRADEPSGELLERANRLVEIAGA